MNTRNCSRRSCPPLLLSNGGDLSLKNTESRADRKQTLAAPDAGVDIDDKVTNDLHPLIFEFFYKFARFEFALKECGYLVSKTPGSNAKPNWQEFARKYAVDYSGSAASDALIAAAPMKQIVDSDGRSVVFTPLMYTEDVSLLEKVVNLLNVTRNNLFHGGKHGPNRWEDEKRMRELLPLGCIILSELATMSELEGEFLGEY